MILLIDIPDEVYGNIKARNGSSYFTSKEIESVDTAIRTGVQFSRFKEVASDRITKSILELNEELKTSLRCNQCEYNDIPNAGECYLCFKGIQDCFTPKGEDNAKNKTD